MSGGNEPGLTIVAPVVHERKIQPGKNPIGISKIKRALGKSPVTLALIPTQPHSEYM